MSFFLVSVKYVMEMELEVPYKFKKLELGPKVPIEIKNWTT
jgi:hypothetical protein